MANSSFDFDFDFDTPVKPRRNYNLAIGVLVCSFVFIVLAVASGVANFTFRFFAGLDFLTGAGLWVQFPFITWAIWGLIFGASLAFWLDAPLYGLGRQRWLCLAVPMVLLFGSSIFIRATHPPVPLSADPIAPPPPPIPAPNFAGTWNTGKWGTMTLTQDENQVLGTYTYREGVIEGTASPQGNGVSRLSYKWRNGNSGVEGVGYFDLAADAQSFAGQWAQGQRIFTNAQEWNGTRTAPAKPIPNFTGLWQTEWGEMRLNQGVSTVTGTYAYGGGTIEGNLDGKILRFRWLNRITGETGVGKFTLALYGDAIEGTWNKGNNANAPGEPWNGTRLEGAPKQ